MKLKDFIRGLDQDVYLEISAIHRYKTITKWDKVFAGELYMWNRYIDSHNNWKVFRWNVADNKLYICIER